MTACRPAWIAPLQSVQSHPLRAETAACQTAALLAVVAALRTQVARRLAEGRTRQAAAGRRSCRRRSVADAFGLAAVAQTLGAAEARSRFVMTGAGRPLSDRRLRLRSAKPRGSTDILWVLHDFCNGCIAAH